MKIDEVTTKRLHNEMDEVSTEYEIIELLQNQIIDEFLRNEEFEIVDIDSWD